MAEEAGRARYKQQMTWSTSAQQDYVKNSSKGRFDSRGVPRNDRFLLAGVYASPDAYEG